MLDGTFSFEHNVFADALHFALRIDTNKVPGELKKAYTLMEEDAVAATNPSGFITQEPEEGREGHRSARRSTTSCAAATSAGASCCRSCGTCRRRRVYCSRERQVVREAGGDLRADVRARRSCRCRPARSALRVLRRPRASGATTKTSARRASCTGPEGESQYPEYPWVAKGPEPKDFLGNEFLLWLWHEADVRTGIIATEKAGDVTIYIDRSLDLDCAYGQTGTDALKGDGPSRMPEARDAHPQRQAPAQGRA